jgi:hypothetical protein
MTFSLFMGARRIWTSLLFFAVFSCGLIRADNFDPVLYRIELNRQTVSPGDSIQVVAWLGNRGNAPSIFPFRFEAFAVPPNGKAIPLGNGESYPSTTILQKDQVAEAGFSLNVPSAAAPGLYDLRFVLRGREDGVGTQISPAGGTPQDFISMGTLKIAASVAGEGESKLIKEFAPVPPTASNIPAAAENGGIDLSGNGLDLVVGADRPVIERAGAVDPLGDGTQGAGPCFRIYKKSTGVWLSSTGSPEVQVVYRTEVDKPRVIYHAEVRAGGELAAKADIFFTGADHELRVGFGNVLEEPDYLLTSIEWPRLIEATGKEARLVTGRFAGRLIDPEKCVPCTNTHDMNWYDPIMSLVLYSPSTLATLTQDSMGDFLTSSVGPDQGQPSAGLGVDFTHWLSPINGPWQHWILASDSSLVRLRFIEKASGSPDLSWLDGAKLLRTDVAGVHPPPLYQDTVLYKITMDFKGYPGATADAPLTSLAQAREIMMRMERLTDGMRQIVYLAGAQHEGQDTKYPDVFTVNKKLGTYHDLVGLMEEGPALNAIISFHSLVNEVYKDSPMWDPRMVAQDVNGNLQIYGHFVGGDDYFVNEDWFVRNVLKNFVNRLLFTYPIKDTYHLDVHTTWRYNVDFNPEHPCTPDMGYLARLNVITEFNKHGIDVTSEGFMGPYVGKIGHAWLMQARPLTSVIGEETIPFVPVVYHGHATYGFPSELNPLQGLLYGATFSIDLAPPEKIHFLWKGDTVMDDLYLHNFPFQMLRNREMQNYERHGSIQRVTYDKNTYVEVDVPENQFSATGYAKDNPGHFTVVIDGHVVAKDFSAFLPGPKPGSRLAYSKFGGKVSYDAPAGWVESDKLRIDPLEEDSDNVRKVNATIQDGQITLDLPAAWPVRVSYK